MNYGYGYEFVQNNQAGDINLKLVSHNISSQQMIFENVIIESKKCRGKVLDVCQDQQAKGMLIIYDNFNMPNQTFDIKCNGESVNIINKMNGKYLSIAGNSQNNLALIFQEPTKGLKSQNFKLQKLNSNDQYFIRTFCNKVLDIFEQGTQNGSRVIQYDCQKKDNQIWIIYPTQKK